MKGKNGVVVLKPIQFRGENQNEVECKTDHNKFYSDTIWKFKIPPNMFNLAKLSRYYIESNRDICAQIVVFTYSSCLHLAEIEFRIIFVCLLSSLFILWDYN